MRRIALCLSAVLLCVAMPAWAQGGAGKQAARKQDPFALWNIEEMIERAVRQTAIRYNLRPEQEEFTRKLMASRIRAFLDKYEDEIRSLFTEAIKYQMSGETPSPETVKAWAERVNPMFEEAKRQIIEANEEFRQILSDEQKKIHDIDLKVMKRNFEVTEKRLSRWSAGGYDPNVDRIVPGSRGPRNGPRAPKGQNAKGPRKHPKIVGPRPGSVEHTIDYWDMYVRRFIERYQLDAAQREKAMAILDESKKRAREYSVSHKEDIEKLRAKLRELWGKPKMRQERLAVRKQLQELNKPVRDIFAEMRRRLEQIPTDAQRKSYQQRRQEWRRKMLARRKARAAATQPVATATQRAKGSTTQPAATQPAATQPASGASPGRPRTAVPVQTVAP